MRRLFPLLFVACAGELDVPDDQAPIDPNAAKISHQEANGVITSQINASDSEAWVYLDLESKMEVKPSNPATDPNWDLAFQRFKVKVNGGDSGGGGVEVAQLMADFATVTEAPGDGYLTDRPDGDDEGTIPDYAFSFGPSSETGPWGYNLETHTLSDSGAVWVIKTVEGGFYKLGFRDYYDASGNPGHIKMAWATLTETTEPGVTVLRFQQRGWTYYKIGSGVVTVATPETSREWDFAVSGPAWRTNGGAMQMGLGGARVAVGGYDALTEAPTVGYVEDTMILYPGPPGSPMVLGNAALTDWFDYDPVSHTAQPKDQAYFLRSANGDYFKLQIIGYDEPNRAYRFKLAPVTRKVELQQSQIDASAAGWVYFNFRSGSVVEIEDPGASLDWDLRLSGVRLSTNGGTSGMGRGAAAGPLSATLAELVEVPASSNFVEDDATLGSNQNPLLAEALLTETATTPRDARYVIRTADGGFVKLAISGWQAGRFTLDWAYGGAGRSGF